MARGTQLYNFKSSQVDIKQTFSNKIQLKNLF